jgi:tRNA pseudouridine65 synthase
MCAINSQKCLLRNMMLEIIYADNFLIAINKPHGLLVHRSKIAAETNEFALQILRDQIGRQVTPVHRIDRKTSGVLMFSLESEFTRKMNMLFDNGEVNKTYYAIVRGYTPDSELVDYPLRKENGQLQNAITDYRTIQRVEVPVAFGKHQTQRYSLVEVVPQTGRMHQIRKHFNHLRHPIIGDRPHGCNKQNRLFKERWNITTMMLHASKVCFVHPRSGQNICIDANFQVEFLNTLKVLGFTLPLGQGELFG